ncbi:MAG: threonine synthase [Bacteroidota bacterium]
MKYYSTNRKTAPVSFKEAVIKGLPEDNGLFMPESIPRLPSEFINSLNKQTLSSIAFTVAKPLVEEDIMPDKLEEIVNETVNFDIPVRHIHDNIYTLELFHGPTLAFKDVGARFLARCLSHFYRDADQKITVIVATSGDTGSAVAHGFLGVKNVDVVILYPKGKVSELQEKQLTTLGQNITALEVDGNFDDCQRMVKSAFLDKELNQKMTLTSANSINIARLIPQSFYYFWAFSQLENSENVVFSVPSGNYGNLTAGLLSKAMGLPIETFVASSNANDIVPSYLASGEYSPKPSIQTISNAMDVGNPSNFYRMLEIYGKSLEEVKADISGDSFSDNATREAMKSVYENHGYTLDPHGAVGYLGLTQFMKNHHGQGIFLETAHPAKFKNVVDEVVGNVTIPDRLKSCLTKEKISVEMRGDYEEFKEFLWNRN